MPDDNDYGLWVAGVMQCIEGAHDPIARNTMAAAIVRSARESFGAGGVDFIAIAVPAGMGEPFIVKVGELLGGQEHVGDYAVVL